MFCLVLNARLGASLIVAALAFAAGTLPAAAQVPIMAPFNVPGAVDGGVTRHADVAYADGSGRKLDVYTPDKPMGPSPVVMFIHGGSWSGGAKYEYEFIGRAFAANGYVAVIPDYRKWPEVAYPDFLSDNAQAVRWIEDHIGEFGGDKTRLFLAGHSAGAYNAVMLGLDRSFLREYEVTIPIRAVAGISGPYNFYPFEYDEVRRTFGDAPNPEGTQPVNLVTSDAPPMLLVSGTSDPIVRRQNSEELARRLQAQNIWVTEKYYEGFGHMEPIIAFGALWRWRMPVLADTLEFFQRFGAFPSGVARPVYTPEPPVAEQDPTTALIQKLDEILAPISAGEGG